MYRSNEFQIQLEMVTQRTWRQGLATNSLNRRQLVYSLYGKISKHIKTWNVPFQFGLGRYYVSTTKGQTLAGEPLSKKDRL